MFHKTVPTKFAPAAKLVAGIPSPITLFNSVWAIVMTFV